MLGVYAGGLMVVSNMTSPLKEYGEVIHSLAQPYFIAGQNRRAAPSLLLFHCVA